jgi:hypothetical protein
MPIHRVSDEVGIFGLPALGEWRDYMVPAPRYGPWIDELDNADAGEGFYILCEWSLEYV